MELLLIEISGYITQLDHVDGKENRDGKQVELEPKREIHETASPTYKNDKP